MSESSEEKARRARLRWISLGEAIAIAALVISGLGLWHEWGKDDEPATTTTVVEKRAVCAGRSRRIADDLSADVHRNRAAERPAERAEIRQRVRRAQHPRFK